MIQFLLMIIHREIDNVQQEMKSKYPSMWILPRVVLEAVPKDLLRNKKQRDKAIDLLITECNRNWHQIQIKPEYRITPGLHWNLQFRIQRLLAEARAAPSNCRLWF